MLISPFGLSQSLMFLKRCELIRSCCAGLAVSMLLFNTVALPCLLYVSQLFKPPVQVVDAVHDAVLRIIPAPFRWTSYAVLANLTKVLPFPVSLYDFEVLALAVKARVIFSTGSCFTMRNQLNLVDDLFLRNWYLNSSWFAMSSAFQLLTDYKVVKGPRFLVPELANKTQNLDKPFKTQTILYKYLHDTIFKFDPAQDIVKRLKRWRLDRCPCLWRAVLRTSSRLRNLNLSPKFLSAVFLTWMNAWCTSRRFQGVHGRCRFCKIWTTSDDIEHFAQCPLLKALLANFFNLSKTHTKEQFFILADEAPEVLFIRIVHLYCCKSMFDYSRHNEGQDWPIIYRAMVYKAIRQQKVPATVQVNFAVPESFYTNLRNCGYLQIAY